MLDARASPGEVRHLRWVRMRVRGHWGVRRERLVRDGQLARSSENDPLESLRRLNPGQR